MSEQLIVGENAEAEEIAKRFEAMAARIRSNPTASFGGAMVIVPPGGEAIETLILDAKQDPAQFWAIAKTKADMALVQIDEAQRTGRSFGR